MRAVARDIADVATTARVVETDIPCRLDRLPWSAFHWLVVVALGITWILDGLEVTLVGSLSSALVGDRALGIDDARIGIAPAFISRARSSVRSVSAI